MSIIGVSLAYFAKRRRVLVSPKDQVAKAISLAAYFETLAADPYTEAADHRFA